MHTNKTVQQKLKMCLPQANFLMTAENTHTIDAGEVTYNDENTQKTTKKIPKYKFSIFSLKYKLFISLIHSIFSFVIVHLNVRFHNFHSYFLLLLIWLSV